MDSLAASALPQVAFGDGLGQRRHIVGSGNQALTLLVFHKELTAVPSFEGALRERIARLAGFQHASYARVIGIAHTAKIPLSIALVSEQVEGVRLSEVLAAAERRLIPLEIDAAFCLIRQLVPAVAALHGQGQDAWHGALGPERIIITPDARVVVVEHVVGAALDQLALSRERYWKQLRVTLPPSDTAPAFDRRADVMQMGVLALALLVGRPLSDSDYPARIEEIVDGVGAVSATGLELLPPGMHAWLRRALQLEGQRSFATAIEAQVELDRVRGIDEHGARQALESFLSRSHTTLGLSGARRSSGAAPAGGPASIVLPPEESRAAAPAIAPETPAPTRPAPSSTAFERSTLGVDQEMPEEAKEEMQNKLGWRRGSRIAAAVVLIALASAGSLAARRYLGPGATGTLVVNTNPSGASIVIDGVQRGSSPLNVELSTGNHVLAVIAENQEVRTIPVTITEGGQVAQFIELPRVSAVPTTGGTLQVRTEPPGASVVIDGQPRGISPLSIEGLAPGAHTVRLENAVGSVTEQVTIDTGTTASLVVPLVAPRGAPASGWISITAPVDVQIYEGQRLIGSSRSDRIMMPIGRYELDIVNEALGYRSSRTVQVTPGNVSPIRLDWPKGSVSLNALPWADVWIDGERIGETPIGNVQLPIGVHEILFRHPEFGEQVQRVTVTLGAPARVSADLRKR